MATAALSDSSSDKSTFSAVTPSSRESIGSLLRLFRSIFFDTWIGLSYLYKYTHSPGVFDYLCNALYTRPDDEVEFYLPQICNLLVHHDFESNSLERFILDKCAKSLHFAFQVTWILQAYIDDVNTTAQVRQKCQRLQEDVEIATVNCVRPLRVQSLSLTGTSVVLGDVSSGEETDVVDLATVTGTNPLGSSSSPNTPSATSSSVDARNSSIPSTAAAGDALFLARKARFDYFHLVLDFVDQLQRLSDGLRKVFPVEARQDVLRHEIAEMNATRLPGRLGMYLPLWPASFRHFAVVRIPPEECRVLNSRERVPYIVYMEVVFSEEKCSSPKLQSVAAGYKQVVGHFNSEFPDRPAGDKPEPEHDAKGVQKPPTAAAERSVTELEGEFTLLGDTGGRSGEAGGEAAAADAVDDGEVDPSQFTYSSPFGERWRDRRERIRHQSPWGHVAGWDMLSVIVKYGDDCRQEQLAMQLINQFKFIFDAAQLPLYLRPYGVLVVSGEGAVIETVPDAISLHQLKKNCPDCHTLAEWFRRAYGEPTTPKFRAAQRNFVESLAAYSLVCYLLQVKDRHNGNILIDRAGHIIHIDFGFMLSNSPGSMNFENSPFKLTQEWVELMDGEDSDVFHYFRALVIRGFMEARKHMEKIVLLVEMMFRGSKLPCLVGGQATVDQLRERFQVGLTQDECVEFVEGLIRQSLGNWRNSWYDRYQWYTNGVHY